MPAEPDHVRVERLDANDVDAARETFALMADVFEVPHDALSDGYVTRLLTRADFWALAVFVGDRIAGGLTAHTLPMTTSERAEIFIFDIAVHADQQRRGHGRRLIDDLRARASAEGIDVVFVPADNEDVHAIDFYRALGGVASPVTIFEFAGDRAGAPAQGQ